MSGLKGVGTTNNSVLLYSQHLQRLLSRGPVEGIKVTKKMPFSSVLACIGIKEGCEESYNDRSPQIRHLGAGKLSGRPVAEVISYMLFAQSEI